ncbi:MAG: Bax inhibitor-1/YccA family protein [Deltaproteobacteria bacterium]|nr:Bax inhibitor-1/YccA family protein [Deltaproteobacteria bacterium]MBW2128179.1 Bax inhibitor-1/YccA family protein [Deltaproteobacteria bacterium]
MQTVAAPQSRVEVRVNEFVRSVYNWMCVGLGITAFVAYYVSSSSTLYQLVFQSRGIFLLLIIAELALVFSISGYIHRLRAGTATGLFVLYSALNGVTLSFIFRVYAHESIANTFFICSGTFLACSIYGWTTKRDLTSFGGFLVMGLFGIILASLVNLFMANTALGALITYVGVFVFIGLCAYDTQMLKNMALTRPDGLDESITRKGAILGALRLYLDFINLFLLLLRIFGSNRE